MFDEIVAKLSQETFFSKYIEHYYNEVHPSEDRATIMQLNLPGLIQTLYEPTDATETYLNFFVIPKILNRFKLQETLEFIDLLINPLLNELPWIRLALGPELKLDINATDLSLVFAKYQQEDDSCEVDDSYYLSTLLAVTILEVVINEMQVIIQQPQVNEEKSRAQLHALIAKSKQANSICKQFLTIRRWSYSKELTDKIQQLFSILTKSQLQPTEDVLKKFYFDSIYAVFDKKIEIYEVNTAFFYNHLKSFLNHYKDQESLDDPMQNAINKILNLSLLNNHKPLAIILEKESTARTLINFVKFLFLTPSASKAKKQLEILTTAITTKEELDTGISAKAITFLFRLYNSYQHHKYRAIISDLLIEHFSFSEQSVHYFNYTSFLPDGTNPSKEYPPMICEGDDFKLALALCLSTISPFFLLTSKRNILDKVTPNYRSQGILRGWYSFSKEIKNETWLIDKHFLLLFNDLFKNALFQNTINPAGVKDAPTMGDVTFNKQPNLTEFCHTVQVILTDYLVFFSLNHERNPKEKRNFKLRPWINLFHITLNEVRNNQLATLLAFIHCADKYQFKTVFTISINLPYLFNYFNTLYLKEKRSILAPGELANLDDISNLLQRSIKKYKTLPIIRFDNIDSSPTATANFILTLLVLVSQYQNNILNTSHQIAWKTLVFSILNQIFEEKKDRVADDSTITLQKAFINLVETQDLSAVLPREEQKQLLKIVFADKQGVEEAKKRETFEKLLLDELHKEEIAKKQKEAIAPRQPSKKYKSKTTVEAKESKESDDLAISISEKQSPVSILVSDEALFENMPIINAQNTVFDAVENDAPPPSFECTDLMVALMTPEPVIPSSPQHDAVQQLIKNINRIPKKMNGLLHEIESITELPQGFFQVITKVKMELKLLEETLQRDNAQTVESQEPTPETTTIISYNQLNIKLKHDLEWRWNKTLGQLCWDLRCAFKTKLEDVNIDTVATWIDRVNSVIDNLSTCYFKNLDLKSNMPSQLKLLLDKLATHCLQHGFVTIIKGSYFISPSKAHDLDLLLIPVGQNPATQDQIEQTVDTLIKTIPCTRGRTFFGGTVYQHSMSIGNDFDLDLNFLFKPFVPNSAAELQKTAEARFSFTAVHLYPDGHAVMLPQTARAICTERPVLTFLGAVVDESETGYLSTLSQLPQDVLGYLAKNMMKFDQHGIRFDQFLTWFKHYYIDPSNLNRPKEGVSAILHYLLCKELYKRPSETIHFILDNQLINTVYPLDKAKFPYELCAKNFKHYFSLQENYVFIKSPSLFLSLFFLSAIMNKSPAEKEEVLGQLYEMQQFCKINTALIVEALHQLPNNSGQFNIWTSMYKKPITTLNVSSKNPIDICNIMLSLWHPDVPSLEKTLSQQDIHEAVITNTATPYLQVRFFKQAEEMGRTEQEANPHTSAPHNPSKN